MTAAELKALGPGVWGSQSGLLAVPEMELLGQLAGEGTDLLEVGHFHGLSTCVIVRGLRPGARRVLTVDAHCRDSRVGESDPGAFFANRARYFDDPRLEVLIGRSEQLVAPLPYDWVFYDGDHEEEQRRFTEAVLRSLEVRLFVFDDRDFPVPLVCMELMRGAGWVDESPPLVRGPKDKQDPTTMTLAVWRRPPPAATAAGAVAA